MTKKNMKKLVEKEKQKLREQDKKVIEALTKDIEAKFNKKIEELKKVHLQELETQKNELLSKDNKTKVLVEQISSTLTQELIEDNTKKHIEEIKKDSMLQLESKNNEIKMLTEQLDSSNDEVIKISEELESTITFFEKKIDESLKESAKKDHTISILEAQKHAYDVMRENYKLRVHADRLLECESKKEVDKLKGIFLSVLEGGSSIHPIKENRETSEKGLNVMESVSQYLDRVGTVVENGKAKSSLAPEQEEQRKLSGLN